MLGGWTAYSWILVGTQTAVCKQTASGITLFEVVGFEEVQLFKERVLNMIFANEDGYERKNNAVLLAGVRTRSDGYDFYRTTLKWHGGSCEKPIFRLDGGLIAYTNPLFYKWDIVEIYHSLIIIY